MTMTKKMLTTNDVPRTDAGFTLIELSIVMVIIGLIVGAILVGQNLINSAKARAFLTQIEKYNSAVNTFKEKFNCLPGDCANATDFGFVRNGDGNGMVTALVTSFSPPEAFADYSNDFPANPPFFASFAAADTPATTEFEGELFWNELSAAGLITGLTQIGLDAGGLPLNFPLLTISHEWLALAGWGGSHYYRTGYTQVVAGQFFFPCSYSLTPADVYYIATKYGQVALTTTFTYGAGDPDAAEDGDQVIVVGDDPGCPNNGGYYYPPLAGAGGPTNKFCVNNSTTPPSLNVAYYGKVCNIMLKAQF